MSATEIQYPLTCDTWGAEELEAIQSVVRSGMFTMGKNVRRFEEEFERKFGCRHAVMVNSGSSANLIGVAALFYKHETPLKRGDEVIVPAISWATTFHPLQQYGLKLRFVDIDLQTLNMDVRQLERALTPKTRMVMAVSILGNPAALDQMRAFCDKHGLYLFEDNCESMGATLAGRQCGTFGDIGTFSTFYSHHISTMEGGVAVTDDDELYELMLAIRDHGWTRRLPANSTIYSHKDDDFFEAYRFILPGYNLRPLELSGAIGIEQLRKLDSMIEARRRNATHFNELFSKDERFIIQKENGKSSWFCFTMVLNPSSNLDRKRVMERMKSAGIEFRIITGGCFLRHDAIRHFDYEQVGEMTNANLAHDRGFFVGNFPKDCRTQIDLLRKTLSSI